MPAKRKPGRGRGVDATGRSKREGRFLKLEHFLLHSAAWRALKPVERAIYLELAQRFNGSNNGEISFSVREAADYVHCAKDTATKAFHELETVGFIRRNICGSFDYKKRHATTWILTEHPYQNNPATKDFMSSRPENLKPGPKQRTRRPNIRTRPPNLNGFNGVSGPHLGPKH